ncbi:heptaprenyl diphosphate synthase component 1 [Alkalicoccobacillus murimartini]|uniref:Heptaprenyl diphosphate synthase n=1 Tax=Alkalicoccobacillus murimartini TaxID=171685 RepID=A0ABT9YDH8_9BACI|nr:heptaprenyl diphosphate synthase component 1 [Alkalicoccobacillus murimartini]MDQ0205911.1 heptaprenyl diphosphate synthase [Alkalicoccobacillus murimartini]
MVNPSHLHGEVTAIIEKFNQLTYHPYIKDYIPSVGIDEGKCQLFYAALSKNTTKEEASVVTLCALLVQAALDVHEEVSLHPIDSDTARKNRQLHVLIGDYYSSLYYNLLAEADRVPLTRLFSCTLQEINEQKMDVYEAVEGSYAQIADHLEFIESGLYGKILEEYELPEMKAIFESLFFYNRYMDEWNKWSKGESSLLMKSLTTFETADASTHLDILSSKQGDLMTQIHMLMDEHSDFRQHMEKYLSESVQTAPNGLDESKVR